MKLSEELKRAELEREENEEKKRFLLVVDKNLWDRFTSKIVLSSNPTEKIIELIKNWVIDYEFAEGKGEKENDSKK